MTIEQVLTNKHVHRFLAMTACLMIFGVSIETFIAGAIGILTMEFICNWIVNRH